MEIKIYPPKIRSTSEYLIFIYGWSTNCNIFIYFFNYKYTHPKTLLIPHFFHKILIKVKRIETSKLHIFVSKVWRTLVAECKLAERYFENVYILQSVYIF